jgi:regulator of protease activity HflC (stomatin/prohibitin superfamily)
MNSTVLICLIIAVIVLVVIFLAAAIKIVPEYKRLVVFRLGRCIGPKGPGLVLLIPFIDRPVSVAGS